MLNEDYNQIDGGWSPDGKQIVYGRREKGGDNPTILLLDPHSKRVSTIPGSLGSFAPRWSPDGQDLVAISNDSHKLLLFDFKMQKWSDWVTGPGGYGYPSWSRDGHYLYFMTFATNEPGYYRVKFRQNHSELVVDLKNFHRFVGAMGSWSGITPDGAPLFVRDLSTDEIYALDLELP
jgi:Tol biopolymer transport system component